MKLVSIVRGESTDQGTFGVMTFGREIVYTTELPWLDNLPHRSCVPPGEYPCHMVASPHFGKVYGVFDTPGRSSVLIHPANYGGNIGRGWQSELEGCIAPAMRLGALRNKFGNMQRAGLVSRTAVSTLMRWGAGESFTLRIQ